MNEQKLIEEIKYRRIVIGWHFLKVKDFFDRGVAELNAETIDKHSVEISKHRAILAGLVLAASHCANCKSILTSAEVEDFELAELNALLKPTDPSTGDIISFSA